MSRPSVASTIHPAPAPPAGTVACHVDVQMTGRWVFGFTAQLVIDNVGDASVSGWTLRFRLAAGLHVGGAWNGTFSQHGGQVTVRDVAYDRSLPPGGSINIGFLGTARNAPISAPHGFTLNGTACTVSAA